MNNYTEEIAQTTTNSQILTDILRKGKDDYVSRFAALNPHCPPEALAEVLRRNNNDLVSRYAARNPNCPPESLAEVLRRGKDDWASRSAAYNSNCPIPELNQWLTITNNLNNPEFSKLLSKIQQYLQQQEYEQNILLKNAKSKYTNPIFSLEI